MHLGDHFGNSLAAVTSVTASTNSTVALYGTSSRKGVTFYNHSSAACFLKLGDGASVTSFTVKMSSGSYYEMPRPIHTGSVTATWDGTGGFLMITQL